MCVSFFPQLSPHVVIPCLESKPAVTSYAQELLSTFSTSLGEVALQPSTGGVFVVQIHHISPTASSSPPPPAAVARTRTLWDRKTDGGFPETKELKRRVRDVIEPGRSLGHVDRDYPPPRARAPIEEFHATTGGDAPTTGTHHQEPAGLGGTSSRPRPSAEVTASASTVAERLDLTHRTAVSPAAGDAGPEPKCEDCQ
ncbi:hypothetical protein, variant [Magnaporthiopsis poae ATCC 64411]|uniref:Selenoprotein W family protein n=1 Tax=Magnaporthiopsis poae (strain ATCC 64411 / 73-15) TaxID=644358 RepID=A0A0C4E376_MAGP6|nr:hypothetical protein, variant [Magnaporthiopsis poae ATCC 64411]